MANYERTLKSAIWDNIEFQNLTPAEKHFYFLLHLGNETSDTSVFPITLKTIAYRCDCTVEEARIMIQKFIDMELIMYDFETSEILVKDYFVHNPPRGGIRYNGYAKDFAKIKSHALIQEVAEIAKGYQVTIGFLAALSECVDIDVKDYKVKKTTETLESAKTVTERGLATIAANRAVAAEKVNLDVEFEDEDLPF